MKVESMPPSIVNGEPCAIDEGYLSDLCRFMTLMMSMAPISGVQRDMDVSMRLHSRVDRLMVHAHG